MTSIPPHFGRVPNMLSSQLMLGSLNRTNRSLLDMQVSLATGLRVMRPSEDVVASSTISVLEDLIERREQRMRNLTHGEAMLNMLDAALGESGNLVMESIAIGLSQIGVGSDTQTRNTEALVIDSIINQLIAIGNQNYQGVHIFGGVSTANAPMQELFGGFQYIGQGSGQMTDLGLLRSVPITVSAEQAFGAMSARVQGARDLEPAMIGQTRLADLNGARGLGISRGQVYLNVDGTDLTVDLSEAHSVQDVVDALQAAIQTVDPGATVSIDPASGRAFAIEPSAGVDVAVMQTQADPTADDLGLVGTYVGGVSTSGGDVSPKLMPHTPLTSLSGVTVPMGSILISNAGQTRHVDLSTVETVEDLMNAVASANIGVRVEISPGQDRLNMINQLSGGDMSIGEVGGGSTATQLGIRSMAGTTLLSEFNNGRGVEIRSGSINAQTGDPDPDADVDFRITLKNGDTIDVDLAGAGTVQDVLDMINAAAAAEGLAVPGDFVAALAQQGNGITITDNTNPPTAATTVVARNGSFAAEHLGILGTTGINGGATLTGQDRATVAVESVISHLMALRDALKADDTAGISLATSKLEADVERFTQTRAEVGVRARRVADAKMREEDLQIQDLSLKSQLQDLDYTEAAMQFALLQQQLMAGLQTAGKVTSLTLLDFLR